MQASKYPFSVRLIGFTGSEAAHIAVALDQTVEFGPAYFCLSEDSLQEPDLFIANGDDLKALATLAALHPSDVQPALIIGAAAVQFPFPHLERPVDWSKMIAVLTHLIGKRADALSRITAAGLPAVPERRRRERLDFDLTDPSEYEAMRKDQAPGSVLCVDKSGVFRDHLLRLLEPNHVMVEWTDSAATAVQLCGQGQVSVVMVNTSTPGIEPYGLCRSIKGLDNGSKIAVVFLVNSAFPYESAKARRAGVRGLLDKPVADRHLLASLKRLLSLPR